MRRLREFWDRFVRWYWRDPIAAERHRIECDARRFNGNVFWNDRREKNL